eukprot:gene8805-10437_t
MTLRFTLLGAAEGANYTFGVVVSKGERRSSSTTWFTIFDGSPPVVSIAPILEKVNPDEKLTLAGDVASGDAPSLTLRWSCAELGASLNESVLMTPVTQEALVVRPDTLAPGAAYTFVLTGEDRFGPGSAAVTVTVNVPPCCGTVMATPAEGVELETVFAISAPGWSDDDAPLFYRQMYRAVEDDTSQWSEETATRWLPLTSDYTTLPDPFMILSTFPTAGLEAGGYKVQVRVAVMDAYGAVAYAQTNVTVREVAEVDTDALLAGAEDLLRNGDMDGALRLASGLSAALNDAAHTAHAPSEASSKWYANSTAGVHYYQNETAAPGDVTPTTMPPPQGASGGMAPPGRRRRLLAAPAKFTARRRRVLQSGSCAAGAAEGECSGSGSTGAEAQRESVLGIVASTQSMLFATTATTESLAQAAGAAVAAPCELSGSSQASGMSLSVALVAGTSEDGAEAAMSADGAAAVAGILSSLNEAGQAGACATYNLSAAAAVRAAAANRTAECAAVMAQLGASMLQGAVDGEAPAQVTSATLALSTQRCRADLAQSCMFDAPLASSGPTAAAARFPVSLGAVLSSLANGSPAPPPPPAGPLPMNCTGGVNCSAAEEALLPQQSVDVRLISMATDAHFEPVTDSGHGSWSNATMHSAGSAGMEGEALSEEEGGGEVVSNENVTDASGTTSVVILGAGGEELRVSGLEDAVEIVISLGEPFNGTVAEVESALGARWTGFMECRYWDEANRSYSTNGCRALPNPAPPGGDVHWRGVKVGGEYATLDMLWGVGNEALTAGCEEVWGPLVEEFNGTDAGYRKYGSWGGNASTGEGSSAGNWSAAGCALVDPSGPAACWWDWPRQIFTGAGCVDFKAVQQPVALALQPPEVETGNIKSMASISLADVLDSVMLLAVVFGLMGGALWLAFVSASKNKADRQRILEQLVAPRGTGRYGFRALAQVWTWSMFDEAATGGAVKRSLKQTLDGRATRLQVGKRAAEEAVWRLSQGPALEEEKEGVLRASAQRLTLLTNQKRAPHRFHAQHTFGDIVERLEGVPRVGASGETLKSGEYDPRGEALWLRPTCGLRPNNPAVGVPPQQVRLVESGAMAPRTFGDVVGGVWGEGALGLRPDLPSMAQPADVQLAELSASDAEAYREARTNEELRGEVTPAAVLLGVEGATGSTPRHFQGLRIKLQEAGVGAEQLHVRRVGKACLAATMQEVASPRPEPAPPPSLSVTSPSPGSGSSTPLLDEPSCTVREDGLETRLPMGQLLTPSIQRTLQNLQEENAYTRWWKRLVASVTRDPPRYAPVGNVGDAALARSQAGGGQAVTEGTDRATRTQAKYVVLGKDEGEAHGGSLQQVRAGLPWFRERNTKLVGNRAGERMSNSPAEQLGTPAASSGAPPPLGGRGESGGGSATNAATAAKLVGPLPAGRKGSVSERLDVRRLAPQLVRKLAAAGLTFRAARARLLSGEEEGAGEWAAGEGVGGEGARAKALVEQLMYLDSDVQFDRRGAAPEGVSAGAWSPAGTGLFSAETSQVLDPGFLWHSSDEDEEGAPSARGGGAGEEPNRGLAARSREVVTPAAQDGATAGEVADAAATGRTSGELPDAGPAMRTAEEDADVAAKGRTAGEEVDVATVAGTAGEDASCAAAGAAGEDASYAAAGTAGEDASYAAAGAAGEDTAVVVVVRAAGEDADVAADGRDFGGDADLAILARAAGEDADVAVVGRAAGEDADVAVVGRAAGEDADTATVHAAGDDADLAGGRLAGEDANAAGGRAVGDTDGDTPVRVTRDADETESEQVAGEASDDGEREKIIRLLASAEKQDRRVARLPTRVLRDHAFNEAKHQIQSSAMLADKLGVWGQLVIPAQMRRVADQLQEEVQDLHTTDHLCSIMGFSQMALLVSIPMELFYPPSHQATVHGSRESGVTWALSTEGAVPEPQPELPVSRLMGTLVVLAFLDMRRIIPEEQARLQQRLSQQLSWQVADDSPLRDAAYFLGVFKVMLQKNRDAEGWLHRSQLWRLIFLQRIDGSYHISPALAAALDAGDTSKTAAVDATAELSADELRRTLPPALLLAQGLPEGLPERLWATLLAAAKAQQLPYLWVTNPEQAPGQRRSIDMLAEEFLEREAETHPELHVILPVVRDEAAAQVNEWRVQKLEVLMQLRRESRKRKAEQEAPMSQQERSAARRAAWREELDLVVASHPWVAIAHTPATDPYTCAQRVFVECNSMLLMLLVTLMLFYSKGSLCCVNFKELEVAAQQQEQSQTAAMMVSATFVVARHEMDSLLVQLSYLLMLLLWSIILWFQLSYAIQIRAMLGKDAENAVIKDWGLTLLVDNLGIHVLKSIIVKYGIKAVMKQRRRYRKDEASVIGWYEQFITKYLKVSFSMSTSAEDENAYDNFYG